MIIESNAVPAKTPLKAVRITTPSISRTICIITIRGHSLSPAAAKLVEMCDQLMAPPRKRARAGAA